MKSKLLLIFSVLLLVVSGCRSDNDGDGKGDTLLSQEEWDRLEDVAADIWNEYQDSQVEEDVVVDVIDDVDQDQDVVADADSYWSWPTNYSDRNYNFYWKTQAEGRNHAAVLLSSKMWGKCEVIELWHNGQLLERIGYHVSTKDGKPNPGVNGNRPHFYLKKLGKDYPNGTVVRQLLLAGGYEEITVPNTAVKFYQEDK